MRTYKIRKSSSGTRFAYRLTVPPEIGSQVPEDIEFVPELNEDGLLYRVNKPVEIAWPSWVKEGDNAT